MHLGGSGGIPGRVFLERRLPCSGIAEPSLHVFQRRGIVKKVTVPDRDTKRQILTKGGARAPGAPLVPPPMTILILQATIAVVKD